MRDGSIISLPLRTVNALNKREHWAPRAARYKAERQVAYLATPACLSPPLNVYLTRIGKRLMDTDGLAASFKAVRDGIADKIGINDGSAEINFRYSQRTGKEYGIEIAFEQRAA